MNRKRSQLQAYFAGIFDGEGFVGVYKQGGSKSTALNVVIGMTDPRAIGLILKEYPEACFYLRPNKKNPWKPCYIVRMNHYKAYEFLRDIEPFVLVKKEQVKVALSYLSHCRRDHQGQHNGFDCKGRCNRLVNKLIELKEVEHNRVKTVNLHEMLEYRAKPEDVKQDEQFIQAQIDALWEGVETKDRHSQAVEPISALEQDIVQTISSTLLE